MMTYTNITLQEFEELLDKEGEIDIQLPLHAYKEVQRYLRQLFKEDKDSHVNFTQIKTSKGKINVYLKYEG